MSDEVLEISREKLFDLLSKSFTAITDEAIDLMKRQDKEHFVKRVETIIDDLNHDILEKSKREKPFVPSKDRVEVSWE